MRHVLPFVVAFVVAFALLSVQVRAQDTARTCNPGETIVITGAGAPVRSSLLLRFGGRPVGGGLSDAGGSYQLALAVGRERPGDYPIVVEVRETRAVVQRLTCTIPGAPTPRPAGTPGPAASAAPTRAPVAPTAALASPTATPETTPGTVVDGVVSPAWWPCAEGQIKGNNASQIYHRPDQRDYARTYADVTCFDSDGEAEAAGFRAAQQ